MPDSREVITLSVEAQKKPKGETRRSFLARILAAAAAGAVSHLGKETSKPDTSLQTAEKNASLQLPQKDSTLDAAKPLFQQTNNQPLIPPQPTPIQTTSNDISEKSVPLTDEVTAQPPIVDFLSPEKTLLRYTCQEINKYPINNPQRLKLEKKFWQQVENAKLSYEEVMLGLSTIQSPEIRFQLIQKINDLAEDQPDGNIKPLPQGLAEWCAKNNLNKSFMIAAYNGREKAKKIIEQIIQNSELNSFRPDLLHKIKTGELPPNILNNLNSEDMLPTAAAIYKLAELETSLQVEINKQLFTAPGLNIGQGSAANYINTQVFPHGIEDLQQICNRINQLMGVGINIQTIPGSKPIVSQNRSTTPDVSGGAIYLQMMPDNMLEVINMAKAKTGIDLNPGDLVNQVGIACLFLAQGEEVIPGKAYRYGYIRPDLPLPNSTSDILRRIRAASFSRWNDIVKIFTGSSEPQSESTVITTYEDAFLKWQKAQSVNNAGIQ